MSKRRSRLQVESLEKRDLMSYSYGGLQAPADTAPVLMVLPNTDFWYQDYADPRHVLEQAGFQVKVAAAVADPCRPQGGSGGSNVLPDLTLAEADASDYSAVVFVGGWGASAYQYAFEGTYANSAYNGSVETRSQVNDLINEFVDQDKYVTALCHGVSVLAWARVDGQSLLNGRTVTGWEGLAPQATVPGYTTRWHVMQNGANMLAAGSIGDPNHAADDVWVDGKIITGQNYASAKYFGRVLAEHIIADVAVPGPATVSVVTTVSTTTENGGPLVFTVSRTNENLDDELTVNYSVSGDVTGATGSVVIPAGQSSAVIELTPIDDSVVEPDETITLVLEDGPGYVVGEANASAGVVEDNDVLPVLLVIANQDFYYQEYADTRASLEAAGVSVVVGAASVVLSTPHAGSGQGHSDGSIMPDIALQDALAANYSAIAFVGGWGASSYQYAFEGTYLQGAYNDAPGVGAEVNRLINEFVDQDKYVAAICHGVSVLAWARVDGVSPISGRTVTAWANSSPAWLDDAGDYSSWTEQTTRWHVESNGATMLGHGEIGDPNTSADDVIVDGRIITAENYDSAAEFGEILAVYVGNG